MNKKLLSVFALVLFAAIWFSADKSKAESKLSNAWLYTECTATGTVIFNGPGYVKKIYTSSGTQASGTVDFAVLIDSPVVVTAYSIDSFNRADRMSRPLLFRSTVTATPESAWTDEIEYPDNGVFISSAAFLFKSAGNSGQAIRAGVLWRK